MSSLSNSAGAEVWSVTLCNEIKLQIPLAKMQKKKEKKKKKKLTTLGISLLVSLLSTSSWKSLALLPPQGQNSNVLPDVSERSSQR